jgi:putative ABC transport system permease protein
MLFSIVLVMNGIYQGNIADGVWLIENTGTDLWVVERGRGGPFNESSRLPADAYRSVAATPGVARAGPFIAYSAQREIGGASQQFTIIGYDVYGGLGGPIVQTFRTANWSPTKSDLRWATKCSAPTNTP